MLPGSRRVRRLSRAALVPSLLLVACAAVVTAFGEGANRADRGPRLMDGSRPEPLPSALARRVPTAVMTRTRAVRAKNVDAVRLRTCENTFRIHLPRRLLVVERLGVNGSSLTFAYRGAVHGCDTIRREPGRPRRSPWCGGGYGRITPIGLKDPRLSVTCHDRRGKPTAIAWLRPAQDAWWIVVHDGALREVYELSAGPHYPYLPVRVTTRARVNGSRATFVVDQYGHGGKKVSSSTFEAAVAG